MELKTVFYLFSETFKAWKQDNVPHLSAALAYYAIFSLAPVLILCISLLGFFFEENKIIEIVVTEINQVLGQNIGLVIEQLMENIKKPYTNFYATLFGFLILTWGAAGLFSEIQFCFNSIWSVKPKSNARWWEVLKKRFISFAMILAISFILLISLLISAFIAKISEYFYHVFLIPPLVSLLLDFIISTLVITILFAIIFKVLPDVILKWKDVLLGAFISSLFFGIGKLLLSIYLTFSNITTIYGAAASLIILLLWVYYATQILLLGVEFSKVYAHHCGSHVKAVSFAKQVR
jgi:membrane protein